MDDALAHERLNGVLELIDRWGGLYEIRWGHHHPHGLENPALDREVKEGRDEVRKRTRFAREVIAAMGENELATRVVEYEEGIYGGHPFTQARVAIVEAIAILTQREELAEIVGPVGPRLAASELHSAIWGAAAALWDDGHFPQAIQAAASALEAKLQAVAGIGVSGADLGNLFSLNAPTQESPRLRIRSIDRDTKSKTWKSAHEGAASLVRGALMGVRNLLSHPGWPEPTSGEALEMLAVLSYVARLVDRCDPEKANQQLV